MTSLIVLRLVSQLSTTDLKPLGLAWVLTSFNLDSIEPNMCLALGLSHPNVPCFRRTNETSHHRYCKRNRSWCSSKRLRSLYWRTSLQHKSRVSRLPFMELWLGEHDSRPRSNSCQGGGLAVCIHSNGNGLRLMERMWNRCLRGGSDGNVQEERGKGHATDSGSRAENRSTGLGRFDQWSQETS